jgi:ribosomal-protein-alanine N-acetyltransferase
MTEKYTSIDRAENLNASALCALFQLDQDYFPTPWSKDAWDNVLLPISHRYLLIVEDNDVVKGFALFETSIADSFAHLLKIIINPNSRKSGLGKNLLKESVKLLMSRDIKTFFLEVEENNTVAINLYKSMGFKIIHQKKQFYSSGATALIMTLTE